jgi:phosphoglucosamine mutase
MTHYFGTDGIRGRVGESPINAEFALKLGWSLGTVLAKKHPAKKVLIGKDTRLSGYLFESALEAGLISAGLDVHLLGPIPTPAVAYLTRAQRASAGIVISASHNPYDDNGFKFFCSQGFKLSTDLELAIEDCLAQVMQSEPSDHLGVARRIDDAVGRYIEYCKSTVDSSLNFSGLKIVLDCAHGATYAVAPSVFEELGASVVSMGVSPNGRNINCEVGSLHPSALQQRVLEEKADFGIAFDGDGDRVVMVDHQGHLVDGDQMLYLMAVHMKKAAQYHSGVVGTVMSNLGLEQALSKLSIPFCRTAVGDRYVLEAMLKKQWRLGGEQSGHLVCLDYATTGDGIISALQVLSMLMASQSSLKDALKPMQHFPQKLFNVRYERGAVDIMQHERFVRAIKDAEKALSGHGRLLVRKSGTEPLLRIMIESTCEADVDQWGERLVSLASELFNEKVR